MLIYKVKGLYGGEKLEGIKKKNKTPILGWSREYQPRICTLYLHVFSKEILPLYGQITYYLNELETLNEILVRELILTRLELWIHNNLFIYLLDKFTLVIKIVRTTTISLQMEYLYKISEIIISYVSKF